MDIMLLPCRSSLYKRGTPYRGTPILRTFGPKGSLYRIVGIFPEGRRAHHVGTPCEPEFHINIMMSI